MYFVDYLNLGSFIRIIIDNPQNIVFLFRNKNKFIESFLFTLLRRLDKKLTIDSLDYSDTEDYIYQKVLNQADEITESILLNNEIKFKDFNDEFYDRVIYKCLQYRIYRSVSIATYVRSIIDSKEIKKILISSTGLNSIHSRVINHHNKVFYYKSVGWTDDTNHYGIYSSNNYSFTKYLYAFISFFRDMIFFPVLSSKKVKTEILAFLNTIEDRLKFLQIDFVLKDFKNAKVIQSNVFISGTKVHVRTLEINKVLIYISYLLKGIIKIIPLAFIDLIIAEKFFHAYIMKFHLNNLLNKLQPKVVLCGYPSVETLIAGELGKKDNEIISLGYNWSLGYPPIPSRVEHFSKILDRYFVFGEHQKNYITSCNSNTNAYIITGYVGDIMFKNMKEDAENLRNKLLKTYDAIIAIYDTSFGNDLIVSKKQHTNFIIKLIENLKSMNICFLVKSKKDPTDLSGVLLKYSNISLSWGHGRLIEAFAADVTISYQYNTIINIANAWNCNVIFKRTFEEDKSEWNENIYSNDDELINMVKTLLKDKKPIIPSDIKQIKKIDYFRDGNAQKRIKKYISEICESEHQNKVKKLLHVDNIYKNKFGLDTII